jgi:transcriptional regulator with XRE-family HTH domain
MELDIGDKIRSHRAAAHITGKEAAKILGVSRVMVSLWERGKFKPNEQHAPKVQDFLKLSPLAVRAHVRNTKKGKKNGKR